jgi:hypothetical protein
VEPVGQEVHKVADLSVVIRGVIQITQTQRLLLSVGIKLLVADILADQVATVTISTAVTLLALGVCAIVEVEVEDGMEELRLIGVAAGVPVTQQERS